MLWTREYFLFHSLLPSCNCSVLMAWALLNVRVSSCSHRLALCTSGCLLMALGAEPTTVDPFHFLLCLACPFSSAKWAWSIRFPSLTVKRRTPAPSFCGRSRSLAAGLQSVCSTPSFRKAFCSKSAVDFNLSPDPESAFSAKRPLPPALTCASCLLWLSPRIHSFQTTSSFLPHSFPVSHASDLYF